MSAEANAVARLQELALLAAKAMGSTIPGVPPPMAVTMVCTKTYKPRGETIKLIDGMKSPRGQFLSLRENGERFDCIGRFDAMELLAFCMAKLDEMGAECPVVVCGPDGEPAPLDAPKEEPDLADRREGK